MSARGYTASLLPMEELEARQEIARQRTIASCVRMLDQGIEVWQGISPWYFDEARKVIAERDAPVELRRTGTGTWL